MPKPMSRRAKTIYVFGLYLVVSGIILLLIPNLLLAFFGLPPTQEVWIRLLGVLGINIGGFNLGAARREYAAFFRWMIYARLFFFLCLGLMIALHLAPPVLLIFGAVDFAGAAWTAWTPDPER